MENLRIGVVGYSAQKFDIATANSLLYSAFDYISMHYPNRPIEIVSGLTLYGIPKLAYEAAFVLGYSTRGIAPECAVTMPCWDCDEVTIVGKTWGDESETFLNSIDILLRIGGGKQSHEETNIAKSMGIVTMELELDIQENE